MSSGGVAARKIDSRVVSTGTEPFSNRDSEQQSGRKKDVVGPPRYQPELEAASVITLGLPREQDDLSEHVKEMAAALEAKDERLRTLVSEVTALRREADRAKKSAKFDLVAREGQTKKLGILEHSVTTLRHDLQTSNDRRRKLEDKTDILERSWQNERSLRLQDLHRHDAMSSDTKHAEKVAMDTEGKWLVAEERVQTLETALEVRVRALEAQRQINEVQAGEIDAQAAEIEMHRTEVFGLKRTLLTREGEISVERTSTSNLRRELSRVRRDFIISTTNRSEQQSALLGGRRKNPTSGQRVRVSRSSNDGSISGERSTSNAWGTGMVSAPTDASGRGVSRLEASILQEPRGGVSWDDVFMSKVDATSSATFGPRGNDFTRIGKSADWRLRCAPKPGTTGRGPTQTDTRDGHVAREPELMQDGLTRSLADPSSTLLVPGSLYVGRGLGLKNIPAWVPPVGSAKDTLKKIMEDDRGEHRAANLAEHRG